MRSTRRLSARPRIASALALALLITLDVAHAQEQTASQEACIRAVSKGTRAVAKAQATTNAACLKRAARDQDPAADGDGIPDAGTNVPVNEADFSSSSSSADTDGDGLSDADDPQPRFAVPEDVLMSTPVRDGTIGPSEYGAPYLTVSDPDRPADFSATLYVTWNAAGLNLAIRVVDESIDPTEYDYIGAFDDGGDNVRLRLDLTNDGFFNNPASLSSDNLEIAVAPALANNAPRRFAALHRLAPPTGYTRDYDTVPGSSIPAYWAPTSDGYVVELLVPANAMIGFTPAACTPMSFQVQVYDRDLRQTSAQLTYQFLREGAVALVHHQDYQSDSRPVSERAGSGRSATWSWRTRSARVATTRRASTPRPTKTSWSAARRSACSSSGATRIAIAYG